LRFLKRDTAFPSPDPFSSEEGYFSAVQCYFLFLPGNSTILTGLRGPTFKGRDGRKEMGE